MQNRRSDDIMDRWWWYIIYIYIYIYIYIHIVVFFLLRNKTLFCLVNLYQILSFNVSCRILSYYLLSYLVVSHHLLSYLVVYHRLLSYLHVSYHLLSYLVISSASRVWFKPFTTSHLLLNTFREEGKRQKKREKTRQEEERLNRQE